MDPVGRLVSLQLSIQEANKCAQLATYIYLGGFGVTATLGLAAIPSRLKAAGSAIVSLIKNVCTVSMGIVGRVVAGIIAGLVLTNIVSFAVNVVTADRKDRGCSSFPVRKVLNSLVKQNKN